MLVDFPSAGEVPKTAGAALEWTGQKYVLHKWLGIAGLMLAIVRW